ncbi:MAG: N-acetylmuramoyl-L-alanine amidase [Clostridiales bacterium]|nr:N-acetylmuramoyl-L-alanine amidase [Clostridiales bacterium]
MKKENASPKEMNPAGGSASNAEKKENSRLLRRLMLVGAAAALVFASVAGTIFYLSKTGKLDKVKAHFSSSSSSSRGLGERSASGKKGEFYISSKDESSNKGGKVGIKNQPVAEKDDDDDEPFINPYALGEDFDIDDLKDIGLLDDNDDPDFYDPEDFNDPDTEAPKKTPKDKGGKKGSDYSLPDDQGNYDLTGYTIILDPGHGGRDTGCVFPFDAPQYNECDFTLRIAKRIKSQLEARGATVYMTRTDNSWVSLYNRIAQTHLICLDIAEKEGKLPFSKARANELRTLLQTSIDINEDTVASGGMSIMVGSGVGEDLNDLFEMEYKLDKVLFLSVHLNSSENRTLHGNSIFYVTDESVIESERRQRRENSEFQRSDFPIRDEYYGRHGEDNELLACCLYDNIVGNIPEFETNATPVKADNYAVLREHGLTGCLIETAFLSDDNDRAMLQQDETVDSIAVSVSDSVKMYFIQKGI